MTQTSSDPPDIDNKRPGAFAKAHGVFDRLSSRQPEVTTNNNTLPLTEASSTTIASDSGTAASTTTTNNNNGNRSRHLGSSIAFDEKPKPAKSDIGSVSSLSGNIALATSSQDERQGPFVETKEGLTDVDNANNNNTNQSGSNDGNQKKKRTFVEELRRSFWLVATYSWLNVLLIFVPIGIVVANISGVHGGIIFAMNCIAVIPLAGLLSHATESVASKMGDSLGALLNVTFGNAVELIIFIIALVKDEIRIVQASLLGSILANLLLILGMGFFLGGLRFREQVRFTHLLTLLHLGK